MPIGRLHHLILDCPDPIASARFWSALLGEPVTWAEDDFVVVSADTTTSALKSPVTGRLKKCPLSVM